MSAANHVREADRLEPGETPPAGNLDLRPLTGDWTNTNPASRGIVRLVVSENGGGLRVRVFGAGTPAPIDWGEVPASVLYADGLRSRKGHAFLASFDFGFAESHLQCNLSQGLLIVAAFNVFKDGSGRSNYFSREFYHS
jgi:hypothetical protein